MNVNQQEENVVSDLYDNYNETQKEILAIEIRKTKNKLISIAIVIFAFDLFSLLVINAVSPATLVWILIIPLILAGLAFLSVKEPLAAMIIGAVIIVGLWVYTIVATGGRAAISGWIGKAIIIYLLIAGFQNAREATKIKSELKGSL